MVGVSISGSVFIEIFYHNIFLNTLILSVFLLGIALNIFHVLGLRLEYNWLNILKINNFIRLEEIKPKILLPISIAFFNGNLKNLNLTTVKNLLSSVEERLYERREYTKYITGLCVFLGLVGTFWGLSKTVMAIASVINGIDINATDIKDAFENLKCGLYSPLKGMGYAFSSSLFGLIASLSISLIDLIVSKTYSEFYHHVEEVLTTNARATAPMPEYSGPAYSQALLQQLCETIQSFQLQLEKTEDGKLQMSRGLQTFFSGMGQLDEHLKQNVQHLEKITHQHVEIQQQVIRLLQMQQNDASKQTLKTIDITAKNILMEMTRSREQTLDLVRQELRLLTKTISAK